MMGNTNSSTEIPGITINQGYIKLNTNYIPKFYEKDGEVIGKTKLTNMQELNDVARKRFPNKLFNVPQDELNKFMRKEKNA